jgi:vitamin-K-epoxide reductase (warfarin-sensitive)
MQTSMTSGRSSRKQRLYTIITVLAVAGVLVSSVSLYHHFSQSQESFCDLSQSFNCDLVNRSQYSTFHGLPVALIGILGYLLILALATVYRQKAETPIMLAAASVSGTCFALYLTYLEGHVIHAWCILCLSSLADITLIAVLSAALVKLDLRSRHL